MELGISDVNKWAEKAASCVREMVRRQTGAPVGLAICFYDPMEPAEKQWRFQINLANDTHEGFDDSTREQLLDALEFIMAGVQKIFGVNNPVEDFRREVKWDDI